MLATLIAPGNAVLPRSYSRASSPVISRFPTGVKPFTGRPLVHRGIRHASIIARRAAIRRRVVQSEAATFTSETNKAANPLRIVFISAEVGPWSKTGGLGDVVGGLPIALAQRGHNVLTIAPRYFCACFRVQAIRVAGKRPIVFIFRTSALKQSVICRYDQYADAWDTSVTRNIDGQEVRYFHTRKNGVDRVWIDNEAFLAKVRWSHRNYLQCA